MADGSRPPWTPRALREAEAAYYVGVSASTFRSRIVPEVPGVRVTEGCIAWYREDLDAWLDRRAGRAAAAPEATAVALPGPEGANDDLVGDALRALNGAKGRSRRSRQAGRR